MSGMTGVRATAAPNFFRTFQYKVVPDPGDKSASWLHVQTRLASQAVGLEGLRQRRGAGRPAPLLTFRPVGVGGERPAPSTSGPQCTGAPLVWRPARKGLRTAILGSCTETRPCSEPRPISEARRTKHILQRPSSSAYIHYEPENLSPLAGAVVHALAWVSDPPGLTPFVRGFAPRHSTLFV